MLDNLVLSLIFFCFIFLSSNVGFHPLSSMHAKKNLKNIGLESEDYHFFQTARKGLLCTYVVLDLTVIIILVVLWKYHIRKVIIFLMIEFLVDVITAASICS